MNAKKDANGANSLIAGLNTNGKTIQRVYANASTHALSVNNGTTGSDFGPKNALIDENGTRTLLAVSKINSNSIIAAYADSNGKLLIQSM